MDSSTCTSENAGIGIPDVLIHVLPGGLMPKRQTDGAIGYDADLRAIVSPWDMDAEKPYLRKTLFDFENMPGDPGMASHVSQVSCDIGGKEGLVYDLLPGESVTTGLGFITAMPFPLFYWMAPRSGLASKYGVTVTNVPGTVDQDYRGEAGAIIKNGGENIFQLRRGMRIVQCIFQYAVIPNLVETPDYKDLPKTVRDAGGFGSTGL